MEGTGELMPTWWWGHVSRSGEGEREKRESEQMCFVLCVCALVRVSRREGGKKEREGFRGTEHWIEKEEEKR